MISNAKSRGTPTPPESQRVFQTYRHGTPGRDNIDTGGPELLVLDDDIPMFTCP